MTCPNLPGSEWSGAASTLLAGLLDGPPRPLDEVARTRVSVHYATGVPAVPVLVVCTPDAVRLPASLVTSVLPGPGVLRVGGGRLAGDRATWRVTRWWRPDRPSGLVRPGPPALRALADLPGGAGGLDGVPLPGPSYDGLVPADLVGLGAGLTPAGDDVLAGALVTAHATGDPRLSGWRASTLAALDDGRTTPVSVGMLRAATDGYATPQLAGLLRTLCAAGDDLHAHGRPGAQSDRLRAAVGGLLAVGHSSGAATLAGVVHTLSTYELEGAA